MSPDANGDGAGTGLADLSKVLPQYAIPQHLLSTLLHAFARITWPPLKDLQIGWFARFYRVDMGVASEPDLRAYPDFNRFFTRALRPEARPLPQDPAAVACPADGRVSAFGSLAEGELLQAKGLPYRVEDLLGGEHDAGAFRRGRYVTVYLSPRDYHRVHMPVAGRLLRLRYVPGRLFSVNASTTRRVPGLFTRNERVVALFDTDLGAMALVLVGAIFVGGIETVWTGPVTPPHGATPFSRDYPRTGEGLHLARGAEMGRFNLGSTVIALFEHEAIEWTGLTPGATVQMGQVIGRLPASGP